MNAAARKLWQSTDGTGLVRMLLGGDQQEATKLFGAFVDHLKAADPPKKVRNVCPLDSPV